MVVDEPVSMGEVARIPIGNIGVVKRLRPRKDLHGDQQQCDEYGESQRSPRISPRVPGEKRLALARSFSGTCPCPCSSNSQTRRRCGRLRHGRPPSGRSARELLAQPSCGTTIHSTRYGTIPGSPPGKVSSTNPSRNQKELMPKKSASPPHTPPSTRLRRDRRSGLRVAAIAVLPPSAGAALDLKRRPQINYEVGNENNAAYDRPPCRPPA